MYNQNARHITKLQYNIERKSNTISTETAKEY